MQSDILILGSGLSGLTFGALMARCAGRKVRVLEAHEHAGGYGHTFAFGKDGDSVRFNAQLHYVWNCGPGRTVDNVLQKLGLGGRITFEQLDHNGFDHMRAPGYALDIPYSRELLLERLARLFPDGVAACKAFLDEAWATDAALARVTGSGVKDLARGLPGLRLLLRYRNATLQDVFDRFAVPRAAQTLLALQWPDFLLPPNQLSFFSWVLLFTGYCKGAYYPTHHFEHVINTLVETITAAGGEVLLGRRVINILMENGRACGALVERVDARGVATGETEEFRAAEVVSNMDPRKTAEMVGLERFAPSVRRRLGYSYSASNFMAYCVVEGLDLREHGFGRWNTFHAESLDLNAAFESMMVRGDYSHISFAACTPSLMTDSGGDVAPGKQILELLTVANYDRFLRLELGDPRAYRAKKQEIFDRMLDVLERDHVPNLRKHLVFKMTGSPTTNERFVLAPQGNSYGADMTPKQFGLGRPNHFTSIPGLHFCNASAGYPGFSGTFWTGSRLYEVLTGDSVHHGPHVRTA